MLAVALWFVAGAALARAVPRTRHAALWLNRWVINVALPALILARLPSVDLGAGAVVPFVSAWVTIGAGAGCVVLLSRRLGWKDSVTGAMLLVVPLGNTSFLGLPVTEAILGRGAVTAALAFDQLGTFLALATWGSFVAGRYGSGARGWRPMARRLVSFAPFLALLASGVLRAWHVPSAAQEVLSALGRTVAPVALVALGLRFSPGHASRHRPVVTAGLTVKMAVLPAVVALAGVALGGLAQTEWQVSVLQSAMPPMVTAGVVGIAAGLDEDLLTTVVGLGTVIGLVSMSVVSFLV